MNQTNIEEFILQLYESHKGWKEEIEERHTTQCKVVPQVETIVQNNVRRKVVPYSMKKERHTTKKNVDDKKNIKQ